MSSNTTTTTMSSVISSTTKPVSSKDSYKEFTTRVLRVMKDQHYKGGQGSGMKFASYLRKQRPAFETYTEDEIAVMLTTWVPLPKEPKEPPVKVKQEDNHTVITVSSTSSSKPKNAVKNIPVEDIKHILTAVRALRNVSAEIALNIAISSLQAIVDKH